MFIISVITKISLKNIRLDIESITMYIYCTNLRRHRDVDWPFYRRLQTVLVLFSCPLIGVGVAFHESNFHVQFVFPFVLLPRFFHVFSNDPFSDWSWYLKKVFKKSPPNTYEKNICIFTCYVCSGHVIAIVFPDHDQWSFGLRIFASLILSSCSFCLFSHLFLVFRPFFVSFSFLFSSFWILTCFYLHPLPWAHPREHFHHCRLK